MRRTENLNVVAFDPVPTPAQVKAQIPLPERHADTIVDARRAVEAILDGRDPRLFAVVGPCSIHDPEAGLDYARRLRDLARELAGTMVLLMRVYF